MTEAASPTLEPKPGEYVQVWADSFSQVMAQIMDAPVPCSLRQESPGDIPPGAEDDLWMVVTSAGALRGEMRMRLSPASAVRLAQLFVGEPAAPESLLTPDHREAVVELLRQVSGIVSTAARERWGELQLSVGGVVAAPSWPSAETFWLDASFEGQSGLALEFGLSAALVAELRAGKIEAPKSAKQENTTDSSPAIAPVDSGEGGGTLDLLMDVQLALSMRFGSRRLLLREVLDLSPGAVVELDRRVQEPVDLLLDGRLVARGEVVVIDGNYGLRVSEVSSLASQIGRRDG